MMFYFVVLLAVCGILSVQAFKSNSPISARTTRMRPLHENFFLDFAADPQAATPRELYGEVNYKNFVDRTVPDGMLSSKSYDVITRARQLKLPSLLAESGLLEALQERGLTLSKVEKLLPLVDELDLLPLIVKNKELLPTLLPLLIEPAPLLLPLTVKLLKTSPGTFILPGVALLGAGAVELGDNLLLAVPAILTGLPLVVLGGVLNLVNFNNIPTSTPRKAISTARTTVSTSSSAPAAASKIESVSSLQSRSSRPVAGKVKVAKVSAPTPKPTTPVAISKPAVSAPAAKKVAAVPAAPRPASAPATTAPITRSVVRTPESPKVVAAKSESVAKVVASAPKAAGNGGQTRRRAVVKVN